MDKKDMLDATRFLRKQKIEQFYVFCIKDGKIIEKKNMGYDNTDSEVYINMIDILEYLQSKHCKEYFISHNHPGTPSLPSEEDVDLTKCLYDKTYKEGIIMIDHLIVSEHDSFSFKDTNFMNALEKLASA